MLNIRTRVIVTCLCFVAVSPVPAQPEMSFPGFMQQLRDRPPPPRVTSGLVAADSNSLSVDGKQVRYSLDSSALVHFLFDSNGYRNTYILDCAKRQFRWVENVRLTTGEVTDNSAGAEWKPLSSSSTISNAVFDVACTQVHAGKGVDGARNAETNATGPSFDCSKAGSWSEKTVCNDPTAATLDLEVARLYKTARARAISSRKEALKSAQLEWIRERENCKQYSDKLECLLNVYHDRIAELGSIVTSADEVSKAAADGYTVPKMAKITLAADTQEEGDLDSFLGIWEFADPNTNEEPRYFKVLRIHSHQFRLIEGSKNWYVNDKDKIRWFDRSQDPFESEPPMIYLQPSEGKLVGQFVSGSFRPTHSIDFTYRLTLEKKSPHTLRYSVWLSQDGNDGRTETFEATKMAGDPEKSRGSAEHSEHKSSSSSSSTTGSAAPADRIQVKDGSVLAGVITKGELAFKTSFGKVNVVLGDVVEFSAGKLSLADGTVLAGGFVKGEAEVATSVGKVEVPAREIVEIKREGQGALETMENKEQGSEDGPSRMEVEAHLLRAAGAIYTIQSLQYETYPAYDGNAGRISCTGNFELSEPLYATPPTTAGIVTVSEDAGISPSSSWKYGQNKFEYFWVSQEAGLDLPFRCELLFQRQVDRWFINGELDFSPPRGRQKLDLPNDYLIVGSSEYKDYVEALKEKKTAFAAIENAFKQGLQHFYAPGNMRIIAHPENRIRVSVVMGEFENWREVSGIGGDRQVLITHGEATLESGTVQNWEAGRQVPVRIETSINEDVRDPGKWQAKVKGVFIVVRDSKSPWANTRFSTQGWNGTSFPGELKIDWTIE